MTQVRALQSRLGDKLPAGMSKADVDAVLQFLYGAFDKRSSKQTFIFHPYAEGSDTQVSIADFSRWLQALI